MVAPEFKCYLKFLFKNNFDVNEITLLTGVLPCHSHNYSPAIYTRKTNIRMEGCWWHVYPEGREYINSWDLNEVLTQLFAPFKNKIHELNKLIVKNNGKVYLDIYLYVNDRFPELSFEGETMQIIRELNADININGNISEEE